MLRRVAHAIGLSCLLLVATESSHADVPPSDGLKRVSFSFTVKGLDQARDRVFFAYPCGTSSGTPIIEYRKLEDGVPVQVGRRGGSCEIYSIATAAYDGWVRDYQPKSDVMRDPALETLASQAVKCTGKPTPLFEISKNDARSAISQTLTLTASNATSCSLTSESDKTGSDSSSTTTPKRAGSCSAAFRGASGFPAIAIASALLLAIAARRRKSLSR